MKNNKIAILVVALLLVSIFVLRKYKSSNTDIYESMTYTVTKGDLPCFVSATGNLESEQSTNINAPMSLFDRQLQIWEITITDMVEEGTVVDSGDYIASLDQNMIQEKLITAEEELELAYNNLEDSRLDSSLTLSNQRDAIISQEEVVEEMNLILAESKYESPATIQKSKMDKDKAIRQLGQEEQLYELQQKKAITQVKQIQLKFDRKYKVVENLRNVLTDVVITAPQNGMVIYFSNRGTKRTVGSSVSGYSNIIATLPDLSTMISRAYVNEVDVSHVKVGQEVDLSVDAFTDKTMKGEIIEVANIGKIVSGSNAKVFEVVIKVLAMDDNLRPAMTTNNIIHTDMHKDVIIVPTETIFSNDSINYVVVAGKNTYRQIVKISTQNNNHTVVEMGLNEGDQILWVEPEEIDSYETKGEDIYKLILEEQQAAEAKEKEMQRKMKQQKSKYKRDEASSKKGGGGSKRGR